MNPLLILAFVGAASESHASPQVPLALSPGGDTCPAIADVLSPLSITPLSHFWALFKPCLSISHLTPLLAHHHASFSVLSLERLEMETRGRWSVEYISGLRVSSGSTGLAPPWLFLAPQTPREAGGTLRPEPQP